MTATADIKTFATRHRLKTVVDIDGTTIVPGKTGHIYEVSGSRLGTMFLPTAYRPRKFAAIKRAAELAGLVPRQVGDSEGCFEFDSNDKAQVKQAIKVAGVRPKRQLSLEHKAKLLRANRNTRFLPCATVLNEALVV